MDSIVILTILLGLIGAVLFLLKQNHASSSSEPSSRKKGTPQPKSKRPGGKTLKKNKFIDEEPGEEQNLAVHSDADLDSEGDETEDEGKPSKSKSTTDAFGKRKGVKWQAKQQAKEEKRKRLEQEKKDREEAKKKEEEEYQERKRLEQAEEDAEKAEEAGRLRLLELKRQKEEEEYNQMKLDFEIEEEGEENTEANLENEKDILNEFIKYIQATKIVSLEELASKFSMKTSDCIDRIRTLLDEETLSGVIDDRGKFIYVSPEELQKIADYINSKGRVSKSDLCKNSGNLVSLDL